MSDGSEKKPLGKILLKQKLVTQQELEAVLEEQSAAPGERLASTLKRAGKLSDVQLLRALSEQQGRPAIDLSQVVIPLSNLDLIPAEIAKQHLILPIKVKEDAIFLAMADPADKNVADEIEFVTGRRVIPYLALQHDLRELLDTVYAMAERGEPFFVGANAAVEALEAVGLRVSTPPRDPATASQPPDPRPDHPTGVVIDYVVEDESGDADSTAAADPLHLQELTTGEISVEEIRKTAKADPRAEPTSSAPKKPVILVVDDEDDLRRLLRRVLTERGFDVIEASRGGEALQAVRMHVPNVILLDAMLPEVHGFDICRRLKSSGRYGSIPIILVTAVYRGWRFAEDLRSTYQVEAFLEKPFKMGEVLAAVDRALTGKREEAPDQSEALGQDAAAALERGLEAYRAGDVDRAVDELRKGVGIDPLSFKLHYHLGLLYGRRDNLFEAIHELETAIDLNQKNFSALKNLAVLYQKAGFKHRSVEMWERALASAPDEATRTGIKAHLVSLL